MKWDATKLQGAPEACSLHYNVGIESCGRFSSIQEQHSFSPTLSHTCDFCVCQVLEGVVLLGPLSILGVIGDLILGVDRFWISFIVDCPAQGWEWYVSSSWIPFIVTGPNNSICPTY